MDSQLTETRASALVNLSCRPIGLMSGKTEKIHRSHHTGRIHNAVGCRLTILGIVNRSQW